METFNLTLICVEMSDISDSNNLPWLGRGRSKAPRKNIKKPSLFLLLKHSPQQAGVPAPDPREVGVPKKLGSEESILGWQAAMLAAWQAFGTSFSLQPALSCPAMPVAWLHAGPGVVEH